MEHDQKSQQDDVTASFTPEQIARDSDARMAAQAATVRPNEGGTSADISVPSPADGLAGGAPPTNRAPQSYIPDKNTPCRVLRTAIDSLYLSYLGELSEQFYTRFYSLKVAAQSNDECIQAMAQCEIGKQLFSVWDKAPRPYAFVLHNACFHIQVSRGLKVPLAYVQVSSQYLTALGVEAAVQELDFIIRSIGRMDGEACLSRADLCADFIPYLDLDQFQARQWLTRVKKKERYWDGDQPTGWKIGKGGPMQSRIYDKVLEIVQKSHKDYLFDIWAASGWKSGEPIWRQEFQYGRDVLKQLGMNTVPDLMANLGGMWRYATEHWLRLVEPDASDSNRARWPNHPLWDALTLADWSNPDQPALVRFREGGIPSDAQFFTVPLGYIASFMAARSITNWEEGLGTYLHEAQQFHKINGRNTRIYVEGKTRLKGRQFGTLNNRENHPDDRQAIEDQAEAYRCAKEGEDPYLAKGFAENDLELNGHRFRASLGILVPGETVEIPEHLRGAVSAYVLAQLHQRAGNVGFVWVDPQDVAG